MPGNQEKARHGGMEFGFSLGGGNGNRVPEEQPFNILIMGNFSSPAARGDSTPLARRRAVPMDVDELDKQLARLNVALRLQTDASKEAIELTFSELGDFHPDHIFADNSAFARLRELRRNLLNPATFEKAAAEVRSWAPTQPQPAAPSAPAAAGKDAGDNPFAQLLGGKAAAHDATRPATPAGSKIDDFIRQIVSPHVVAPKDPRQDDWVAAVDKAASLLMNAILHHADFQALEATWRGLDFVIHNLELDENLTVSMLDVSREELAADLRSSDDLTQTQLYRILVKETRRTPGGSPWSLVVGLYDFRKNEADAGLLQQMGQLAMQAGAPFVAGATYRPGDEETGQSQWIGALEGQAADHVALAAPRLILRLPYGPATEPIDSFPFSEMSDQPVHGDYLWGNPAVACACLIGQTFSQSGWPLHLGSIDQLGGLPLHIWTRNGEKNMTPPAEYWLTDAEAEALAARGLIPLLSIRGSDAIGVGGFQSLSRHALPVGG